MHISLKRWGKPSVFVLVASKMLDILLYFPRILGYSKAIAGLGRKLLIPGDLTRQASPTESVIMFT